VSITIQHIISHVNRLQQAPLPGRKEHDKIMDWSVRKAIFREARFDIPPQPAAVLVLIYPGPDEQARIVLILRKIYKGHHSGQISFPGGKYEKTDTSLQYTALREAHEEIGVNIKKINVIKRLTDVFIPLSNFMVTPFLAVSSHHFVFKKDETEVEQILEISLNQVLRNPLTNIEREYFGKTYRLKSFDINGLKIWGATAMIMAEVRALFLQELFSKQKSL